MTLTVEVLEGQPGPGTTVPVSYRLLYDTALGEDIWLLGYTTIVVTSNCCTLYQQA